MGDGAERLEGRRVLEYAVPTRARRRPRRWRDPWRKWLLLWGLFAIWFASVPSGRSVAEASAWLWVAGIYFLGGIWAGIFAKKNVGPINRWVHLVLGCAALVLSTLNYLNALR